MNRDTVLRLINSLLVGCLVTQAVCLYFAFTYAPPDMLHNGIAVGAFLGTSTLTYLLGLEP